ncbi:PREDICTED: uncharacterized protein LOC105142718 [Populus euphratica]|uniref:Uncharacterized protein LOC105142718 n=1 Tax=Populus euphratica TaxID=75702 RepID=A0AAJ6VJP8_POPEU|nr:PREDICTED: uncharacterized protein LOC105142718 [Populus euphratica]
MAEDCQGEDYIFDDDEVNGEDDCPLIKLSLDGKQRIRKPWRQTLIIKVMGKRIGYNYLLKRLQTLCRIQGDINLVDLGNDFFLAMFSNSDDRDYALFGGPWILPDLAMEYYDTSVLWRIGDHIGKTLKVDRTSSVGTRGNCARICVEVDLTKPVLSKFKLRRTVRRVVYEGLHLICSQCGTYTHKKEICPHVQHHNEDGRDKQQSGCSNEPEEMNLEVVPHEEAHVANG